MNNLITQTSNSTNSSASEGVAAQLGNQGSGIGITASVSKGGGNGNGSETTYSNTHFAGADQVTIKSGGDLTNSGTIAGRNVVNLAAENVNNLGGRIASNDVSVAAREDLNEKRT